MNSEDFFTLAYPGLFILGTLLNIVPAYIAFKKEKNFWIWWFFTSLIFSISLLLLIRTEEISKVIYLLGILPLASILAFLPRRSRKNALSSISNIRASIKLFRFSDVYWYLLTFILAGILFYYLLPHKWDYNRYGGETYPVILALVFLTAYLGYVLFIFMFSEKRKRDFLKGSVLTFLLSTPVLLNPEHAFSVLEIRNLIAPQVDLGNVIAALIAKPVGGIFILFGLLSAPAASLTLLDNKHGVTKTVISIVISVFHSDDYSPPYIRFLGIPAVPVVVLSILYMIFFKVFFHPNESWMFLLPFVWLCFFLPTLFLTLIGTILSSLVIGAAINQKKNVYALGIFLCGLLAIWKGVPLSVYRSTPALLLVFYGMGSGLATLILWLISDYQGKSKIDGVNP